MRRPYRGEVLTPNIQHVNQSLIFSSRCGFFLTEVYGVCMISGRSVTARNVHIHLSGLERSHAFLWLYDDRTSGRLLMRTDGRCSSGWGHVAGEQITPSTAEKQRPRVQDSCEITACLYSVQRCGQGHGTHSAHAR